MSEFFVRQLYNTFRNEMVVLDTPQGIIYIYIYIAITSVQYRNGRIVNSYFWDKLLKSFLKDMDLILGPT